MNFIPAENPPAETKEPKWFFLFQNNKLLITNEDNAISIPRANDIADLPVKLTSFQNLGSLDGMYCISGEIDSCSEIPGNMSLRGLRGLYGSLEEDLFAMAGRALHITDWDSTHQFCAKCGNPLIQKEKKPVKYCQACDTTSYPALSPAVIVAVTRDDSILLAHARRFPPGIYSVLAGYVEPGENLEECAAREIKEETGIDIKNIRYFNSQAWPFTSSLMIAFTAEYAGGSIQADGDEILDAAWFKAGDLPQVPGKISIARQLIDWFVERVNA